MPCHGISMYKGLIVMGEYEGQGWLQLTGYTFGIGLILVGLTILCRGEPAFKERNTGERAALTNGQDAKT